MMANKLSTKQAALNLLRAGIASPSEVAAISGASRQAINFWLRAAGLDWRRARRVVLQKAWAKALRGQK